MTPRPSSHPAARRTSNLLLLFLGLWGLWSTPLLAAQTTGNPQSPQALDPTSDDPEVERQLLQLPEGFEIKLFASEPLIKRPVTMAFDSRGRLWVLCIPRYPQLLPGQTPEDYIVILEDREGKGRADTSHVFVSGLSVPTGFIPGDGGVYVGEGGSLLHYRETPGTGVAGERRVLLTGFGTQDTHHTLNTFRWGPDGGLYFHQGCFLTSNVETPRGLRHMEGSCVWRLRADALDLEVYDRTIVNNNTWGHLWDEWGRSILASAWREDINVGLSDTPLNSSNEPDFVPPIKMTTIGGERNSGVELITGRHFPPDWQNNLITGGFNSQKVYRFVLKDDGEHLSTKELPPLIVSRHGKFRPIDVKMGPDGALYLCDWYNQIIQHNQVNFRDPRRDHEHGRIWRITCKDRPLVAKPDLVGAGTPALLERLKDPEQWSRTQARRVLSERDPKEVAGALATWVGSIDPAEPGGEHALLEGLWVYQTIGTLEPVLLARLLRAKDAHVRAAATTALGLWQDRLPDAVRLVAAQADDPSLPVRLEAVLASQRIPEAGSAEAALRALGRPTDAILDFELRKACRVLRPYWYPAFLEGKVTFGNDAKRLAFALGSARIADAVPRLLDLVSSGRIAPEHRSGLLISIAALGDRSQLAKVFEGILSPDLPSPEDRANALEALARAAREGGVIPDTDLGRLEPLLGREDALGISAVRAVGAWKLTALRSAIEKAARDERNPARRRAALASLADLGGAESLELLSTLAQPPGPYAQRVEAAAALAALDVGQAARVAAQVFRDPPPPQAEVGEAFAAFLRRAGGEEALVGALTTVKPAPEVAQAGLREIHANGWPFPRLTEQLQIAAQVPLHRREFTPELQQQILALSRTEGDASHGERLFRGPSLGCLRCHAIAGAGGTLGPDLATIGTSAQPDFLVEHLLIPTKSVKEGFSGYEVLTTAGDAVSGIRVRENATQIVLRNTSSDEIVIAKSKIQRQREIRTLMPSGLTDVLSDRDFADLVRFLSDLGKPGGIAVAGAAVQRQWRALINLPEYLSLLGSKPLGRALLDDPQLSWGRVFGAVSGDLPLEELAIGPGKSLAVLRAMIETLSTGKVVLALESAEGVRLWLDGEPIPAERKTELALTAGHHTLDAWVDVAGRKTSKLRLELLDFSTSGAGRAQWGSNR